MAIDLNNVEFENIQNPLKKITADFKEFCALLDFQSFIFENNQMRLKGLDAAVNTPLRPRLQKSDFDFLIENSFKKYVFGWVDLIKSDNKLATAPVENVFNARLLNVTQIEFQNEIELAYFVFLMQMISFCDSWQFKGEMENARVKNFIFRFICFAFVLNKCPALAGDNLSTALAFWQGNLYRLFVLKAKESDNQMTLEIY